MNDTSSSTFSFTAIRQQTKAHSRRFSFILLLYLLLAIILKPVIEEILYTFHAVLGLYRLDLPLLLNFIYTFFIIFLYSLILNGVFSLSLYRLRDQPYHAKDLLLGFKTIKHQVLPSFVLSCIYIVQKLFVAPNALWRPPLRSVFNGNGHGLESLWLIILSILIIILLGGWLIVYILFQFHLLDHINAPTGNTITAFKNLIKPQRGLSGKALLSILYISASFIILLLIFYLIWKSQDMLTLILMLSGSGDMVNIILSAVALVTIRATASFCLYFAAIYINLMKLNK